ncbi:ATP-binding protein [Streptosporangium sp. NBC_01755]|uniref:hypothetical protein n=1 Tax=unclassified Streptosporangium TaxID=2632669 RepID=UPI002DD8E4A4|nr:MULTISPECIES: hypothetical protein [unclassified Streptosporangium]WSA25209.1 ATP-binding protein [Streptosporangium sp. NBC_01810]WSD03451.1 ATP-binding protein [Streptosporangium sp. NBC_01755]
MMSRSARAGRPGRPQGDAATTYVERGFQASTGWWVFVAAAIFALPDAQAAALSGALDLGDIAPENRFLVGLATLSLLSELVGDGALLCLIDDAQWFDQASIDALVFAARRLEAEGVAMIFAARASFQATGLPSSGWAGWTVRRVRLRGPALDNVLDGAGNGSAPPERPSVLSPADLG